MSGQDSFSQSLGKMKKKIFIEIEETVTEVRVVDARHMTCPACGEVITFRQQTTGQMLRSPARIETILIKPENVKALNPAKD